MNSLRKEMRKAGLRVVQWGGILYKPLPNEMLEDLCLKNGEEWKEKFIHALLEFGKDRPDECGYLYIVGI